MSSPRSLVGLFFLVGCGAVLPAAAFAQPIPPPPAALDAPATTPTRNGTAGVPRDIVLVVEAKGVDAARLSALLASELGCTILTAAQKRPGSGVLLVSGDSAGELRLRYTAPEGARLDRRLAAPENESESDGDRLDQIRLIASNLVRNEAQDLIEELRRQKAEREALANAAQASADAPATDAGSNPPAAAPTTATKKLPPAAPPPASKPAPPKPPECTTFAPYFSLFHPVAVDAALETRCASFVMNLAYGRVGALEGFALSLGYQRIDGPATGASVGMVAMTQGSVIGAQISAVANIVNGDTRGLQLAAVGNVTGAIDGVLVAGALNLSSKQVTGAQIAGVLNRAADVNGAQIGSVDLATRVHGAQVGVVNVGAEVGGAQIGLVNWADDYEGVQVGLVNVARNAHGLPIGLVNIGAEHTALTSFIENTGLVHAGVRYGYRAFYYQLTVGAHWDRAPTRDSNLFPAGGIGGRLMLGDIMFSEAEAVGQFRAAAPSQGEDWNYAIQARVNYGAKFGPIALFAGAGASAESWPGGFEIGPIFLGGLDVGN